MALELAKPTIDIGIVTKDAEAIAAFYGGVLGLPPLADVQMDGLADQAIPDRRLRAQGAAVRRDAFPLGGGGELAEATGIRYWTVSVTDLDEVLKMCANGGHPAIDGPNEVRLGVSIAFVADPDGNIVEFVGRAA